MLCATPYPYLVLDALEVKCREGGRTVNVCVRSRGRCQQGRLPRVARARRRHQRRRVRLAGLLALVGRVASPASSSSPRMRTRGSSTRSRRRCTAPASSAAATRPSSSATTLKIEATDIGARKPALQFECTHCGHLLLFAAHKLGIASNCARASATHAANAGGSARSHRRRIYGWQTHACGG
jgi:hypothetical protein